MIEGRMGDCIESALATVGVTQERVEWWLGAPCGCEERKQKLNQLGRWAVRVVSGRIDNAAKYLDQIMERN